MNKEIKNDETKLTTDELIVSTNVLEKDRQAYLSDIIKSHGLDEKIVYNIDLATGAKMRYHKAYG